MTTFLQVANNVAGTLSATIDADDTTAVLDSGQGASFPAAFPYDLTIDSEIVRVTNRSTDTLTIERAQQGTSAAGHTAGASVELRVTAKSLSDLNTAVGTLESGSAVLAGRPGGQTLIGGTGSGDGLTLKDTSHATRGIVTLDGATSILLNATTVTSANTAIGISTGQTIGIGTGGSVRGLVMSGTYNIGSGDPAGVSFLVFNANQTINLTNAASDINEMRLFAVGSTISVDASIGAGNVGGSVFCFDAQPTFTQGSGGTATLPGLTGLRVAPNFGSGWITTGGGIVKGLDFAPVSTAGNIKNYIGVDITDLNAATLNLSLRSVGAAVEMRHAGPGVFGANAAPTNASVGLEVQSTTKAFLLPRMTTTERDALTAVNGMVVYNTSTDTVQAYKGGAWGDL